MGKNKPAIDYRGVKIYHSCKGAMQLTYWFALVPNHQAETDNADFDVRELPRKYRMGLSLEPTATQDACNEIFRRAIDDNYDFKSATRRKYMPLWRSLLERVWNRS